MAIDVNNFQYDLPPDRIPPYPLKDRDQSKLLIFKAGEIQHRKFSSLPDYLPHGSLLVFNDTKVIPARLIFHTETGAYIEVFLLNPVSPSTNIQAAMQARAESSWKCTIGNIKRWREGQVLVKTAGALSVHAQLTDRQSGLVTFNWNSAHSFASVIDSLGETPLPPYLRRPAEPVDKERYQTIYSRLEGAVAAPTAGLHFTEEVFEALKTKGVDRDSVTLHVGAGTFLPIKDSDASKHRMHAEQIVITRNNLVKLAEHEFVTAVGTTSMRTLESLYWYGYKLLHNPNADFVITQDEPYQPHKSIPTRKESIRIVLSTMDRAGVDSISGETSIYIVPGYPFRMCDALITNFHQPGSTLILLVAAFIGEKWRDIYHAALSHGYRFLSYGDSSLIMP